MDEGVETDKDGNLLILTPEERCDNEDELIQLCHKLWLDGETDFDYTKVDSDEKWDDVKTLEQDDEDRYFDSIEQDSTQTK